MWGSSLDSAQLVAPLMLVCDRKWAREGRRVADIVCSARQGKVDFGVKEGFRLFKQDAEL